MERGEPAIRSPVLQADQHPKSYLVDAGLAQTIRRPETVPEIGFLSLRMVPLIILAVVGLLIDQHRIEAVLPQYRIFLPVQWLYFHGYLGKMRPHQLQSAHEIIGSYRMIRLSAYQQHMTETHVADRRDLGQQFPRRKSPPPYPVVIAETAICTDILALIRQIKRDIQLDDLAKPFLCKLIAQPGHFLEVGCRCR